MLSADIVEESAGDPGSFAAFTAYADGRVRVKFADRTLLELRRDRQSGAAAAAGRRARGGARVSAHALGRVTDGPPPAPLGAGRF